MQTTLKIKKGKRIHKFPVTLRIDEKRIKFQKQPFSKLLNAEIKAMRGYKWHGFDDPPVKKWSVENHPRNVIQLKALMGENVYEWFERPLIEEPAFDRPEFDKYVVEINGAQVDMIRRGLTYHYQIFAAEQGLGKSLAAIEIMERSDKKDWWYVGPLSALESVEREIKKWNLDDSIRLKTMTYESLVSTMRYDFDGLQAPEGIIFDESDYLKNPTAHRSIAAQSIADLIREQHGMEGYVLLLSGTPAAKNPTDWWSQCEIAWPGFLREGSFRAFEYRYCVMEEMTDLDGVTFNRRTGFDEEEVAALPGRYAGLSTVYRKKEWLNLPEKVYKTVRLEPSKKVMRVLKALCNVAPNAITAMTWSRALSSGFQYVNECVGDKECPVCYGQGTYINADASGQGTCPGCDGLKTVKEYKRKTRKCKTPKDDALRKILDANESHGRIVVAASLQGSIDRILDICKERGWAVACIDGRGWRSYDSMGSTVDINPIDLWEQHRGKVAFVGNPGSCRYGLTLTLAYTLVFYDNSFSAVERQQMEDRIHRMSMSLTLGAIIIDLVHLPIDQLTIDTLKNNQKMEKLSMGIINETVGLDEDVVEEEILA